MMRTLKLPGILKEYKKDNFAEARSFGALGDSVQTLPLSLLFEQAN